MKINIKSKNSGFSTTYILVGVVVFALIAFVGYRVSESEDTSLNSSKEVTANEIFQDEQLELTSENSSSDTKTNDLSNESEYSELQNDSESQIESLYTNYVLSNGSKFEIGPGSGKPSETIKYRMTDITVEMEDAGSIYLVDAFGYIRNLEGFAVTGTKEGTLTIPSKVFNCKYSEECNSSAKEVDITKGQGEIVVHREYPTPTALFRIPFEIL